MKQGIYLAFVYIGLVIGAGFASGREIMQYFNFPSNTYHGGIVLATFLLIAICYIILNRCYNYGISTFNEYLSLVAGKAAAPVRLLMFLYLFCGFFTMLSGSGALLTQGFMLPPVAGVLLMFIICFAVLSFDLRGITAVNMILVPCMIFGIIYICFSAAMFGSADAFSLKGISCGTAVSAICYVSYNTISAPTVLVPLQKGISYKGLRIASVLGGFVLGILILTIWAVQSMHFDALWNSEIPMLKLAAMTGRFNKYIYSAVLFMSICTTAVSQGFGILEYFSPSTSFRRVLYSFILCTVAFPFALIDFSALVKWIYYFFGITGILWMAWIFIDYFRHPM